MKRRVVSSYSSSKTVIDDGKKKKKGARRARKTPRRTVTPRVSSRASTARVSSRASAPRMLTPIRTPPSFSSSPRQAYGSPTGSVSLPSNLISRSPTTARFSPLHRGSSTSPSPSLLRKRPRPETRARSRQTTQNGKRAKETDRPPRKVRPGEAGQLQERFSADASSHVLATDQSPKRKRKEDRKTISDLLHYVDLLGRI